MEQLSEIIKIYERYKSAGKKLDISRGKPSPKQLDIVEPMLTALKSNSDCFSSDGFDCRNYGKLDGTAEAKKMFSSILDIPAKNIFVGGSSSLNLMFDCIGHLMIKGINGCEPWIKQKKVKFLCPVPGYDRHFAITEYYGIEMINIPMLSDGPDMDLVEKYVGNDSEVKGIWCVPKYSNPTGITFSDEVVERFARLKPAAKDFRIFWDNAYAVHDLDGEDRLLNIFDKAAENGNSDSVFIFTSTSKITYSGAGLSCFAASEANLAWFRSEATVRTIGYDKLNQLRHSEFIGDKDNLKKLMKRYSEIIAPKFRLVIESFNKNFSCLRGVSWTNPAGGYFISLTVKDGTAKRVVKLAEEAGLILTGAGSTFPYHNDPNDNNIRIAPTYASLDELKDALELLAVCVKIAYYEKI